MTVLPGKRGASARYPGHVYRADIDRDLAALTSARVGRLILLVDDDELGRWSDPDIVERAAGFGIEVERHPMPDGSPPTHGGDGRHPRVGHRFPHHRRRGSGMHGRCRPDRDGGRLRAGGGGLGGRRQSSASGSCDTRWPSRPTPRSTSYERSVAIAVGIGTVCAVTDRWVCKRCFADNEETRVCLPTCGLIRGAESTAADGPRAAQRAATASPTGLAALDPVLVGPALVIALVVGYRDLGATRR